MTDHDPGDEDDGMRKELTRDFHRYLESLPGADLAKIRRAFVDGRDFVLSPARAPN